MAWETIENVKPVTSSIPPHGVVVTSRRALRDKRYIAIKIGVNLATAARFCLPQQRVRLLFGSGSDAGKVGVVMDAQAGSFVAKKQKSGAYLLTISAAAAEGLFALEFPTFTIDRVEAIRPENGQPPMFSFKASDSMLAVDD